MNRKFSHSPDPQMYIRIIILFTILLIATSSWMPVIGANWKGKDSELINSPASDPYEPDNTCVEANEITPGVQQTRSISPVGDFDWARFTLSETTDLIIQTSGPEGDTVMALYASDCGTELAYNDDYGTSSFSRIYQNDLPAGTYNILVWEYGSNAVIDPYYLDLTLLGPNTPPEIDLLLPSSDTTIAPGVSILIHWTDSDPDDNATISLAYDSDSDPGNGGYTYLTTSLSEDADDAADFYTWSTTGVPPGTYYIWGAISDGTNPIVYDVAEGRVTVQLPAGDSYEPDDTCGTAKAIQSSVQQTRSIYPLGDDDWITFTLTQLSDVTLETSGPVGDTQMWLYASDCSTQLDFDDDDGAGYFSLIHRTGLASGTYYILIRDYGDNSVIDPYYLDLTVAANNTPPTIELTSPSVDGVVFQGTNVTIQWTDSDPDNNAEISLAYDSDSDPDNGGYIYLTTSLTEDPDGSSDEFTWDTTGVPAGTYYIWGAISDLVNPVVYDVAAGRITIEIEDAYEPDNEFYLSKAIISGIPQVHNIFPLADVDWVLIQLLSPSAITIETSGDSGADTQIELFNFSLESIEFDDDSGEGFYSRIDRVCGVDALPAGAYYLKVNEKNNDHMIPAYTISFTITQDCSLSRLFMPLLMK